MKNPLQHRVAITAAGIVSPAGIGLGETVASLRSGRDGATPVTRFDVAGRRAKVAAQVDPDALIEWLATRNVALPRRADSLHHASLMMLAAAEELRARDPAFAADALILGTTGGGMTWGEAFYRRAVSGQPTSAAAIRLVEYSPEAIARNLLAARGEEIPIQIVANACASGTNAIGHAFTLVRSGIRRAVLCGGFDALSELVFAGFDALQATTTEKCRPFDAARSGLLIGEGAALFALESSVSATARNAPILGEIVGYGLSTDTHHLTQPHPSGIGPRLAMERALRSAHLPADAIDAINAHGTATPHNDTSEGAALSELFPGKPVSSTKGITGHALGGAGAIEAVFSLISLREQFIPPTLHFNRPELRWTFEVVGAARPAPLDRVLSNSFGFGGGNASIILRRWTP
jgi:3-oxoacyl-[acyl-carrier-protein] synthase II